jgi:hypothetical protein
MRVQRMHVEFLVEDVSGKTALEILIPKIIDQSTHSFRVVSYKGIGRIPGGMSSNLNASKRILLDQLPRILQGYGKTFLGSGPTYEAAVVIICDLDDKDLKSFISELNDLLAKCDPAPRAIFCVAIEEGEAWFLGDYQALKMAYPHAKADVLSGYTNDAICGTWETLANAVHAGGVAAIKAIGWPESGRLKSEWASKIAPHMDVDINLSPSFQYFRDSLRELVS